MKHDITFALIARDNDWWNGSPSDAEFRRPYKERPKVTLTVDGTETLGAAYRRATRQFGLVYPDGRTPAPSYAFFYRPEDEGGFPRGTWALAVPQEDGTARWRRHTDVTFDELFASADAGALNGDPRRPYIVITEQVGNGLLPGGTPSRTCTRRSRRSWRCSRRQAGSMPRTRS